MKNVTIAYTYRVIENFYKLGKSLCMYYDLLCVARVRSLKSATLYIFFWQFFKLCNFQSIHTQYSINGNLVTLFVCVSIVL